MSTIKSTSSTISASLKQTASIINAQPKDHKSLSPETSDAGAGNMSTNGELEQTASKVIAQQPEDHKILLAEALDTAARNIHDQLEQSLAFVAQPQPPPSLTTEEVETAAEPSPTEAGPFPELVAQKLALIARLQNPHTLSTAELLFATEDAYEVLNLWREEWLLIGDTKRLPEGEDLLEHKCRAPSPKQAAEKPEEFWGSLRETRTLGTKAGVLVGMSAKKSGPPVTTGRDDSPAATINQPNPPPHSINMPSNLQITMHGLGNPSAEGRGQRARKATKFFGEDQAARPSHTAQPSTSQKEKRKRVPDDDGQEIMASPRPKKKATTRGPTFATTAAGILAPPSDSPHRRTQLMSQAAAPTSSAVPIRRAASRAPSVVPSKDKRKRGTEYDDDEVPSSLRAKRAPTRAPSAADRDEVPALAHRKVAATRAPSGANTIAAAINNDEAPSVAPTKTASPATLTAPIEGKRKRIPDREDDEAPAPKTKKRATSHAPSAVLALAADNNEASATQPEKRATNRAPSAARPPQRRTQKTNSAPRTASPSPRAIKKGMAEAKPQPPKREKGLKDPVQSARMRGVWAERRSKGTSGRTGGAPKPATVKRRKREAEKKEREEKKKDQTEKRGGSS